MKRALMGFICCLFMGFAVQTPALATEIALPALNQGIDQLAISLMKATAERYFNAGKRPNIKVAIFDFTDPKGDITVGSRYISNRLKLSFATGPQFELSDVGGFEKTGRLITAGTFSDNPVLRERIIGELKADVYVLGEVQLRGESGVDCELSMWGTTPPFDDYSAMARLTPDMLPGNVQLANTWALNLTPSGLLFFRHIRVAGAQELKDEIRRENLAEVIFLTQPMCDDLNLSWQVRADGMIYDARKKRDVGALRNRTGQIMQSRVKSAAALKELSYVIKNFSLIIGEHTGKSYRLEPYIIPKESEYYFIPYIKGENGLRFIYLWSTPGKSKKPSSRETGKGWNLFLAEGDWRNVMPVGTHTATATLEPIAETDYGTKRPRSEYVSRFKFQVNSGLNIYVINYIYRRDRPEIFVRRLDIEGSRVEPVRAVKRITKVYEVYGGERTEDRGQRTEDR